MTLHTKQMSDSFRIGVLLPMVHDYINNILIYAGGKYLPMHKQEILF